MFEDIHIQSTSSVIEMSILEINDELDVLEELGVIHCSLHMNFATQGPGKVRRNGKGATK